MEHVLFFFGFDVFGDDRKREGIGNDLRTKAKAPMMRIGMMLTRPLRMARMIDTFWTREEKSRNRLVKVTFTGKNIPKGREVRNGFY